MDGARGREKDHIVVVVTGTAFGSRRVQLDSRSLYPFSFAFLILRAVATGLVWRDRSQMQFGLPFSAF
jgi:hypothetical protein